MDFLSDIVMGKPLWMWVSFLGIVVTLLAVDLGIFHRTSKEIGVRESLIMSAGYIAIALMFGAWVWTSLGPTSGEEFLTGYLIEKTLSMDNVFVISLIFTYFAVPAKHASALRSGLI
jgi:tellurite resistance protein TerC